MTPRPTRSTCRRRSLSSQRAALGDQSLGADPETGLPVYLKSGRYGPYVQLGADDENDGKPRRASLWPGMTPETLTLDEAQLLLSFPQTLGIHPEKGEPITAQDGPLGPYIKMGTESRSLRDHDHLASVDLDDAVALLAEPRKRPRALAPRSSPTSVRTRTAART